MNIQLLGNCSILLSSINSQILFDPYFSNWGNPIFKRSTPVSDSYMDIEKLDAILLSHTHFDHIDSSFLNKFKEKCDIYAPKWSLKPPTFKTRPVSKGYEFTVGDFSITAVEAHHLCHTVGYIVEAEGLTLYFSGDTYYGSFMKEISEKYAVDVAMLPVTNYFPPMTMGEAGVLQCLKVIEPRYFIPMHQDLVQRFQLARPADAINNLRKEISTERLSTNLIYLNNGEIFSVK
jgi:L-ascorbate metabolism protein UlaG (beta-lactamase superfamily)